MRNLMGALAAVALLVLLPLAAYAGPAAQADPTAEPGPVDGPALIALINAARLAQGLTPLRASDELNGAAQRHSRDMAATGQVQHGGSDGSRPDTRIAEGGYAAYGDGELYVSENITATTGLPEALAWWQNDISSEHNLSSVDFREIGAGVASGADGKLYLTVTFGSRPNSLPVFVNDDAAQTGSEGVTISLSNETVQPVGGRDTIGQAGEVRVSNEPGFPSAAWRPWTRTLYWELAPGEGLKTVYVQFRDAQGRTTAATDSIVLSAAAPTATATVPGAPGSTPGAASATPLAPGAAATAAATAPVPTVPGRLTPTAPSAGLPGSALPERAPDADVPAGLVAGVCVLQGVGTLLAGYVILRRRE